LLDRSVLPAETQTELLSRAAGNPLYAEQFARMLTERGSAEELPETVQGIIAARLDVLSEAEKALLQDAAVVGKFFWLGSVQAIGGVERGPAEEALLGLERKELVQRARRSSVEGEAEYAFRHLLLRDVAYGQIPRATRADKHRAAAEWVEGLGRPEDHAEMLASHYLSALEYARAAGAEDAELATQARAYSQLHTALNNEATELVGRGRLADARPVQDAMEANLQNDSNIGTRRWVGALAVELNYSTGRWAECMRDADEWLTEADAGSTHVLEPIVRMARASILAARGEDAAAALDLERAMADPSDFASETAQTRARGAFIAVREDDPREASTLVSAIVGLGESMTRMLNDAAIVDAAWAAHDVGRAEEYLAFLDPRSSIPWFVAARSVCTGDFEAAAEVCREMEYRRGEVYARLRAARQLVDEGRRPEADAQLQRSLAFWREVGAKRYVREGEALLAASA
jgi:hypothetical protein